MERAEIRIPHHDDIIEKIAKFETFRVGERLYSADLLLPQMVIQTKDIIVESASTAAFVVYWGLEAARARRHKARVEAAYRAWRDRTWLEIKTVPDENTGKYPSDGVCEKMYRQRSEYGEWWEKQRDAQYSAECAEAVYEAFKIKAQLIKDSQKLLRDEAGGAYTVVELPRNTIPRQPQLS